MSTPNYRRDEYNKMAPRWRKIRAACGGEDDVKALPNVLPYLNPKDTSPENKARNASYLERAVWYNATGRTLEGLVGLAFKKDPEISVGEHTHLLDNADGQGLSIYNVAQKALSDVLQTARAGILVDLVDGKPRIIEYPTESIINWRTTMIDEETVLTLLVLEEIIEIPIDRFSSEKTTQWRVYENPTGKQVTASLIKVTADGSLVEVDITPTLPDANNRFFDKIPFIPIGPRENSWTLETPPLQSLADLNYAHFRDSADYQDSVFFVGQAQAWISGLDEEWRDWLEKRGVYVGSKNVLLLPNNASFGIEQADPNTLVGEAMKNKESQMVSLGARLVEMGTITKTATQAAGDIASSNSVLSLACSNVSEAIIIAIQWCGRFRNGKDSAGVNFRITQDYIDIAADPGVITAVLKSWQATAISKRDVVDYYKKIGIVKQERTLEEINQELEAEPPPLGVTAVTGDINPGSV